MFANFLPLLETLSTSLNKILVVSLLNYPVVFNRQAELPKLCNTEVFVSAIATVAVTETSDDSRPDLQGWGGQVG